MASYTSVHRRAPSGRGHHPVELPADDGHPWKIGPALAPANRGAQMPSGADALTTPAHKAELIAEHPPAAGALNAVTGQGEVTGASLATHPLVHH